jgi:pyruvate-ferredoxin/flavodoxin oxidoreductase
MELWSNGDAPFENLPKIVGGRYGLSSKEFNPAMFRGIFDNLSEAKPKNHFTIGINDDVTFTSLDYDESFSTEGDDVVRAVFYGLGSDGTVGANKNSIKIIGEYTENFAQGHFVYDSKKAGAVTVSHLRFGPRKITSTYQIEKANFIACHQFNFLERYDMLRLADRGATFLLNSPYDADEVWDQLPRTAQETIIAKGLRFYVVDAYKLAGEVRLGRRINTIMQTCFFSLMEQVTGEPLLSSKDAVAKIKMAIEKSYSKRGQAIVDMNFAAVDAAVANLYEVAVPLTVTSVTERIPAVPAYAPEFVQSVTARMIERIGDSLPVSAMPVDGTYPTGTTQYEKRNIAQEIPVWDADICIQCGKCALVCPHQVIRMKLFDAEAVEVAPESFKSAPARYKEFKDMSFSLQVAPEDCTGCTLCVEVCPVKNKQQPKFKAINMALQAPLRQQEVENWDYFQTLPEMKREDLKLNQVKYSQLLDPMFEFSGACAGCGETPYLGLLSRLFGDRALIANATGCSSIYGGNLPTTPWSQDSNGRGPAWSNSLFEDNAEFGMGMRVALDQRVEAGINLLRKHRLAIGTELTDSILFADQIDDAAINRQRVRVELLKQRLQAMLATNGSADNRVDIANLLDMADILVKKSVWIVGGDGWAYDIGYGGLDHVLASGRNVNVLVLDTEVYSNTGGQMSKATPRGAVAKFAAGGKTTRRKDLGLLAISYGNIYVARIAFGANDAQTIRTLLEAEAYDGPSLIIAYSHCIAHGYDMKFGLDQQKAAVDSGYWPLFRYNPDLADNDENPFHLDSSRKPKVRLEDYIYREGRYRMLVQSNPEVAARLLTLAKEDVEVRWDTYSKLAES